MRHAARFVRALLLVVLAGAGLAAAAPAHAHWRGGWGWYGGWNGWPGWYGLYGPGWYGYPYAYGYPSVVVLQQPAAAPDARPSGAPWRYCPDSGLFYPHASECPSGWQTVPMAAPPAATP